MASNEVDDWENVPVDDWEDVPLIKPIKPTMGETAMRMAAQGATLGHADEATAGVGALYDYLEGKLGKRGEISLSDAYNTRIKPIREADKAAKEANPKTAFVAEMAGGIAPAVIAGPALATGKGLLGAGNAARGLGAAALAGGAAGSGYSEADNLKDYSKDVGLGVGLGVTSYGLAKGAGKLVSGADEALGLSSRASKSKDEIAEWLTNKANNQYAKAVTGHSKKALKELAAKPGGIEKYGRDVRNEGIVKFGDNIDDVAERANLKLQEAKNLLDTAYAKADELGATVDPAKIRDRILEIAADNDVAANQNAVEQLLKHAEYFEKKAASGGMPLTQALKEKSAYKYTPTDSSGILSNKEIQNKLKSSVGKEMTSAAEDFSQRPEAQGLAADLAEGNRLYSIAKPAVKAAEDRQLANLANNTLGPSDKAAGFTYYLSKAGNAILNPIDAAVEAAKALGVAAVNKQARTRFSSSAAVTADKIADLLKSAPETLGPYARMLQSAQEKGSRSLGVTHHILMNNDPEYSKFIRRNFGGQ